MNVIWGPFQTILKKQQIFMQRALDLASLGLGTVSPNPMVGCVITNGERIVAEGWHKAFGGPHAEVNAVNDLDHLDGLDVYVTLEPCAHHGKTPPCAVMLAEKGARKVYVSTMDPNPDVAGKGIEILRNQGADVQVGLLREESLFLNRRFFTNMREHRPYVILKWAQTSDGFIAGSDYNSKWISSEISRKWVHKWRVEEDAILVGRNTVEHDNPRLNVRDWKGNDPMRVILDPELKLNSGYHCLDGTVATMVFHHSGEPADVPVAFHRVSSESYLEQVLTLLHETGIGSVMVEGGSVTLNHFITSGLWDEARVFVAATSFSDGIAAPVIEDAATEEQIGPDTLKTYYNG